MKSIQIILRNMTFKLFSKTFKLLSETFKLLSETFKLLSDTFKLFSALKNDLEYRNLAIFDGRKYGKVKDVQIILDVQPKIQILN